MNLLKNNHLMRALRLEKPRRTPIWLMRQAGRYLPEYRKLRQKEKDFMSFCKNPQLASEATLQPIRRFDLDAAIIFSDILTIPDALDCGLEFISGSGPHLKKVIRSAEDVAKLPRIDIIERCHYLFRAIETTQQTLAHELPLIGFSGSPWTLACYMIEGCGSRDFMAARRFMQAEPQAMHQLLGMLSDLICDYCSAQIDAGANVMMLFDSWGGLLGPADYQNFSLNYMKKIINHLAKHNTSTNTPCILFSKGAAGFALNDMIASGANAIGLDWTVDMRLACNMAKGKVALQGNLDPACLFASEKALNKRIRDILKSSEEASGFIFNLGHGINQHTPIESVEALIKTVHEYTD